MKLTTHETPTINRARLALRRGPGSSQRAGRHSQIRLPGKYPEHRRESIPGRCILQEQAATRALHAAPSHLQAPKAVPLGCDTPVGSVVFSDSGSYIPGTPGYNYIKMRKGSFSYSYSSEIVSCPPRWRLRPHQRHRDGQVIKKKPGVSRAAGGRLGVDPRLRQSCRPTAPRVQLHERRPGPLLRDPVSSDKSSAFRTSRSRCPSASGCIRPRRLLLEVTARGTQGRGSGIAALDEKRLSALHGKQRSGPGRLWSRRLAAPRRAGTPR